VHKSLGNSTAQSTAAVDHVGNRQTTPIMTLTIMIGAV